MPLIEERKKQARGQYDFAIDGGAVSTITLRGDKIPSGAIVTDALIHVDTILASGGSPTVAVGTGEATNDVQAATAFGSAPWSTTGAKRAGALTATSAPVKTTAERSITITIATAALTGGKFSVVVDYVELAA